MRHRGVVATIGFAVSIWSVANATAAPVTATNKECDVFLASSAAATAYASVAQANLSQLSPQSHVIHWSKFDTKRMAATLATEQSGETLHYLLYSAGADRKLKPVSLMTLWSIHTNIVYANAASDLKLSPDGLADLKQRNLSILIDSRLLAETLEHAARVCLDGLGAHVLRLLGISAPSAAEEPAPAAQAKLLQLISDHKKNVQAISAELQLQFSDSEQVRERVAAFVPVNLPVWTTVKDEPGSRAINDVWFPKQYAEPLMKSIVDEQAKAMAKGR